MGTTNKVYPMKQDVLTLGKCAYCLVRGILAIDQGELERGVQDCSQMRCGCQLSILNLDIEKKG